MSHTHNHRQNRAPSIPGLLYRPRFVSEAQEQTLLAAVDAAPWRGDLKRRVQHYGWRYDYRSRGVTPDMRLGELPRWALPTAEMLFSCGLLKQRPDQLIVNEYVGAQGINKHIDAPESFADGIASISLGEAWEMVFRQGARKEAMTLERGSALVLHGDARYRWTHEVPARRFEPGTPGFARGRRVSLTFRKVLL